MPDLDLVPVDWATVQRFNEAWHRHHPKPPPGHKFAIGVAAVDAIAAGQTVIDDPIFDDLIPSASGALCSSCALRQEDVQ